MSHKADYLEAVKIFQDLTHDEIESVSEHTRLVEYSAGHLFYMPGETGEVLFILKVGRVQLYRLSPDGRKLILAILQPGAIFGHMALISQQLQHTYAQALDDCTICIWNQREVAAVLIQKPQVALRFLEALNMRLVQAENRLQELAFKRVPARLATLLLQLDAETGQTGKLAGYTHQALADMMGIYRETVTQILNTLQTEGVIRLGRKQIELLQPQQLQVIADGD